MHKKPWRLSQVTLGDIRDLDPPYQIAVLPIGSTEPHNYHLPYGSDTLQVELVADKICESAWKQGARAVVLPAIPYGMNWNLIKFPMTIHMNASTHRAIISDVVKSLEAHGIIKLLILNGHGGNELKHIIRELYAETKIFIAYSDWWNCCAQKQKKLFKEPGEHAGDMETSICMELFPDLVKFKQAKHCKVKKSRFDAINDNSVWITRPWHLLTESSGHGDPRQASSEKGREFVNAAVEKLSAFIVELARADMDEKFPY
ncbi:MAG: creatininase family protein [bacterium]